MKKQFVKIKELQEIIGLPAYSIRHHVRTGTFPAYKLDGKQYLLDVDEIVGIIRSRKI